MQPRGVMAQILHGLARGIEPRSVDLWCAVRGGNLCDHRRARLRIQEQQVDVAIFFEDVALQQRAHVPQRRLHRRNAVAQIVRAGRWWNARHRGDGRGSRGRRQVRRARIRQRLDRPPIDAARAPVTHRVRILVRPNLRNRDPEQRDRREDRATKRARNHIPAPRRQSRCRTLLASVCARAVRS